MADYRSDTVTRPSPGMLEAMVRAPVGDDVFGEDPTVRALEQEMVGLFGMEDGLFCPSGTMTNQIAIKVHTRPGQEVVCSDMAHVYVYEGGGIAFNSGCQVKLLPGNLGRLDAGQVSGAINAQDIHKPPTTLVCLENTVNRGGGSCYDFREIEKIREVCLANGLSLHLDGARIFNALEAKREKASSYGPVFDSISVCLSKGLGCPVGSVLLGAAAFITKARRVRKVLGGGMRQAGFLAAAGLYALENHVGRIAEDHQAAQNIASVLGACDFIGAMRPVETNILLFEVKGRYRPAEFVQKLMEKDIRAMAISSTEVRMVTHLDITPAMVAETSEAIKAL